MARFSGQIMRFQVQAHLVGLHEGVIPTSRIRFSGTIMPEYEERPAAIRRLGDDGQGARRAGSKAQRAFARNTRQGWKPSGTSRPWQDRRTLISHYDQRLAILRMVFLCRAFTPFVNL
jgi:hypothetical protein